MAVTVEQAKLALEGYEQHVKRQLRRTHWNASEDPDLIACLKMRQQWINEYRLYLKHVLADAINAADNIIGKQWEFDHSIPTPAEEKQHG